MNTSFFGRPFGSSVRQFLRRLLAVSLVITFLSAGAFAAATIPPRLEAQLASASANTELTVIITFSGDTVTTAQRDAVRALGVTRGVIFQSLPIIGALATPAQVRALQALDGVLSIYPNDQLEYENYEATALTGADRVRTDTNLTTQNGGLPVSGTGVGVLINDSGIDATHGDLTFGDHVTQNVEAAINPHAWTDLAPIIYVENVPNTDLGGGHGTHVAGIVGATGARSSGRYEGVAPGADLIGYGSGAALFVLDVLGGFDYALANQAQLRIRVVNNSWGTTSDMNTPFDPADPINIATKKLYDRNVVVVFSAGNSGPTEGTITGNYKKAPWVVCVANTTKQSVLEDSSSRGVEGRGGTVVIDGVSYTWEDRPTVAAPGTDIVSARASTSSLQALSAPQDASLAPAHLPFYTHLTGTSMAAPHVAGVVALMLDANPALTPTQVKQILQQTATNIPGYQSWEAGAGMVNAYAAVDRGFNAARNYGTTLNMTRDFHANAIVNSTRSLFSIDYFPVPQLSPTANRFPFDVPTGMTQLEAWADVGGVERQTGNTINLVLIDPSGNEVSSGVSVLFPIFTLRAVVVQSPVAGRWTLELRGLRGTPANPTSGLAAPETVNGTVKLSQALGYTGMDDIAGHPAEAAIQMAVNERLIDGFSDRRFRPDQNLTRIQLADYLVTSTGVRQFFPTDGSRSFSDVSNQKLPFAEAAAAHGSNLRDVQQAASRGVVLPTAPGRFGPDAPVLRYQMAYSLVMALGLEAEALARNGQPVTVQSGEQRIVIDDAGSIPAGFEGFVQLALDLNLMNAFFSIKQGPFDLQPTLHAEFRPNTRVTRAEYAVEITRYFTTYFAPSE